MSCPACTATPSISRLPCAGSVVIVTPPSSSPSASANGNTLAGSGRRPSSGTVSASSSPEPGTAPLVGVSSTGVTSTVSA